MSASFLIASVAFGILPVAPSRVELITPVRNATFNKNGTARERKQGGNPRLVDGTFVFDGSQDGDRQIDPQIAVGGGHILHGTNSGLIIYDKQGNYVQGVPQREFLDGIDPKLFFDVNHRVFGFDLWVYWDKEKIKPVNISISETANPTGAWNTYPVPAPNGVDGGAIGHSRKWVGYSFPGGPEETFVLSMADMKKGKPTRAYHFKGSLGHPVSTQDRNDDLYFVALTDTEIVITRVADDGKGAPVVASVARQPHRFRYFEWPPMAPQKGTDLKTAPGDRNPKNIVLQGKHIWFSQTVNVEGRAGIQWHQVRLDGKFVQSGLLSHPENSYIQTTLAVNKHNDVLVGFQETGPNMFISPRCAFRRGRDPKGTLRPIMRLGEGLAATKGGPWGDYSGSVMDGDNREDLWTVQSIASARGTGDTVIAKIPFRK